MVAQLLAVESSPAKSAAKVAAEELQPARPGEETAMVAVVGRPCMKAMTLGAV